LAWKYVDETAGCPTSGDFRRAEVREQLVMQRGLERTRLRMFIATSNRRIITVRLHVMQRTVLPRHFCPSVRPSVCPSVRQTCAFWQNGRNLCP